MRLPGRQTRRQTRVPAPVVPAPPVAAPPKRDLPELDTLLDTPAPKRVHAEVPKSILPTPTTVQRRSSRLSDVPRQDDSLVPDRSSLDNIYQSEAPIQAATPATRIPAPKHILPQLDTPTPKRPRADEPATPGLPTPTSAPKTRVSTLPVVDYSLPSPAKVNTEACESDETFEDSEEEPESDQEFDDLEERLLDNDSDTEDPPADESVPVTERLPFAKTTVLVPFVDENGLTRIGTQPMKPAVYIGWAPRVDAADRIRNRALKIWAMVDSKFLVSVPIDNSAEIKGLQEKIMGSLGNYLNDESKVMLRCDYTGVEMSWAAGPQSWSIEAIYPYIVSSKRVAYHAPQNIGPVSTALN